jgi:heterodisulfide reductase subunit A-like polyferredoxin
MDDTFRNPIDPISSIPPTLEDNMQKLVEKTQHPSGRVYSRKLNLDSKVKKELPKKQLMDMDVLPKNSKIAIIGSGIAGLGFALALHKEGFQNITIYEKDSSFGQRRQGYGLTIQQAVSSLVELNVFEKVKELDTPAKYHLSK